MTVRELYQQYLQQLQKIYSAAEAANITALVFESKAGLLRSDVIINPKQVLAPSISAPLQICLQNLLQHQPVQYVLNEAWFCNMKLKVDENVLIPRPETEELVQLVVSEYNAETANTSEASKPADETASQLTMLDVGTGSGCIAIAIKKHLPGVAMNAIDVSIEALSVAKKNASTQQVEIAFTPLDFLDETTWQQLPVFDAIISNPPYIPLNEKERLDKNVTAYEPHTALFVPDNDTLIFYKKIADFAKHHLAINGKIFMEVHEDFGAATAAVFTGYYKAAIKKDMFGKERMLVVSRS